jgi:beta-xylosidase
MNDVLSTVLTALLAIGSPAIPAVAENPIIQDRFTADPAALVYKGKVYLYTGHDEASPEDKRFVMRDWRCYSSDDLVRWKDHGSPLSAKAFAWARGDAWASQVIERGGKFYWYATVYHAAIPGYSIGVGVADSPTGPFKDARGSALITNDMTRDIDITWDDLDPTVFIDDGQAYLFWGNTRCRYAKLKPSMTELDGPIVRVDVPKFTEAPWIHKYNGRYYLSYAYGFPEQIAYATADRITGPYTFRGVINDVVPNSPTNHQAIVEFKSKWYFFYHNAALPGGGEHRRSVCVEELFYNPDGTIRPITQTKRGPGTGRAGAETTGVPSARLVVSGKVAEIP